MFVLHSWEPALLIRQLFLYVSDQTAAKSVSWILEQACVLKNRILRGNITLVAVPSSF